MINKLEQSLDAAWLASGLPAELARLRSAPLRTRQDAISLCRLLGRLSGHAPGYLPAIRTLAEMAGNVTDPALRGWIMRFGVPQMLRLSDELLAGDNDSDGSVLVSLLIALAQLRSGAGVRRLALAAQRAPWSQAADWPALLARFDRQNSLRSTLVRVLSESFPAGRAAEAFVAWCGQQQSWNRRRIHPFTSHAGLAALERWLTAKNWGPTTVAAAAALRWLPASARRESFLSLAQDHLNPAVQLAGAEAAAALGSEAAVRCLARWCYEPRWSVAASQALIRLKREDAIPDAALEGELRAMSELCAWLAHPHEFGRPPDEIECVDAQRMYWPPTSDVRPVWLFRYRYHDRQRGDGPQCGMGMVGSITFALFSEPTERCSAEAMYALHCCWELQVNRDPRAPKQRSVAAGRRLLDERP